LDQAASALMECLAARLIHRWGRPISRVSLATATISARRRVQCVGRRATCVARRSVGKAHRTTNEATAHVTAVRAMAMKATGVMMIDATPIGPVAMAAVIGRETECVGREPENNKKGRIQCEFGQADINCPRG
jgi:hypothetical protein